MHSRERSNSASTRNPLRLSRGMRQLRPRGARVRAAPDRLLLLHREAINPVVAIPEAGGEAKRLPETVDTDCVDAAERKRILSRYIDHSRRFDAAAARRGASAEVILFPALVRELEQEPTAREIEILQLVAEGLINREIGQRLFLSEETVKSHVRHLLAKLQARSRAHAVALGFQRGLLT